MEWAIAERAARMIDLLFDFATIGRNAKQSFAMIIVAAGFGEIFRYLCRDRMVRLVGDVANEDLAKRIKMRT